MPLTPERIEEHPELTAFGTVTKFDSVGGHYMRIDALTDVQWHGAYVADLICLRISLITHLAEPSHSRTLDIC